MPSQATATRTTVDITELGFDASEDARVLVEESDDSMFVEVAYEDDVWTLTFDEHGDLVDGPTFAPAPWLGPVIKKAAPELRVL
jgi:hypothetical protein